jgi:hypothetical protein
MIKEPKRTITTVTAIILFMVTIVQLSASTTMRATYPKNFIPFWSQPRGGHEVALLNTAQIVRIVPYFNPNEEEPNHKDIQHLEVYMTDGKVLTVNEDFAEFYQRVRVSQAK